MGLKCLFIVLEVICFSNFRKILTLCASVTDMKKMIVFILAFLSGILIVSLWAERAYDDVIFVVILEGFLLHMAVKRGLIPFCSKICIIILCGLLVGGLRFFADNIFGFDNIGNYTGKVSIKGCVVDEVDVRSDKVKYTVSVEEIDTGNGWVSVDGKVLVSGQRYPVYQYGDCFIVSGKLQKPDKFENFDYGKYLSRYDIYGVIYRADIQKIENLDGGGLFFARIYKFKQSFEFKLSEIFVEPYNSFMAGLILGSRKGISEELVSNFNITGLTHIIAISGYNITLLIVVMSGMFGFLSRKRKVFASIIFITLFVILVGASASVVRAGIMGMIGLVALWFGRDYFVSVSLFSAAFFMNLWNPKILIYDVGFQLSFLATCGLVYVSPRLKQYFEWLPEKFGLRETVTMTMSAQVLALPIILINFERLSLIAPVANVFVLPFIPAAMVFGFFAVVVGYVWSFLGMIIGFFGYLVLAFIIFFVRFFAEMPLASVDVTWFSFWFAGVYYFLILNFLLKH